MIAETLKKIALSGLALAAAAAPAHAHVGEVMHIHPHDEVGSLAWTLLIAGAVVVVAIPAVRALARRNRK